MISWLASYPHFFDGPEYLKLAELNFAEALRSAHASLHPISIWLWQVIVGLGGQAEIGKLEMVSWVAGILGIWVIWKIAREYRVVSASVACLALIFFPQIWLLTSNLTTEPLTNLLMLVAWYGVLRKKWLWVILAGSLAVFNTGGVVLWLLGLYLILERKKATKLILGMVALSLFWWVALAGVTALPLFDIWAGMGGEAGELGKLLSIPGILRMIYQAFKISVYGFTPMWILAVGLYAWIYRREKWRVVLGVAVIYTVMVSWWTGGLFGRIGSFGAYPLALVFGALPRRWGVLLVMGIVPWWIWTVRAYQMEPIPEVSAKLIAQCGYQQDDILITADTERPQLSKHFPDLLAINNQTKAEIVELLAGNTQKRVLITSQALSYPYRLYDGQLPHPMPGRTGKEGVIEEMNLKLVRCSKSENPDLAIYEMR